MNFFLKTRFLGTVFLIVFGLIFAKLFFLQVISAANFSALADQEHFYTLSIPARRGEIKTSDGLALASNKDAFLFYVNLAKMTADKKDTAEKMADILSVSVPLIATDSSREKNKADLGKSLWEKFELKDVIWVNLAHFLKENAKKQINDLKIAGLGFAEEQARDYPESSTAAHLLGFVGFNDLGNPKGYFGLEGFYERELAGKPGQLRQEKDALGRPIAIGSETRREKTDGNNLIMTLDRATQRFTEKELEQGIKNWKATGGTAIVMDPANGAILAMANFPRYDPGSFMYYQTKFYKNPAVTDLFEPGSIIKPLVMAAALNENKLTPETRCDACDGPQKIETDYIHTFNEQYHPNSTMTEVLINSDNTGMVFVGEKLGFINLYNYLQKFGFSQKSGIDLQEEDTGSLRKPGEYYPIDQATLTFGQGIVTNAVQLMRAWATLANGGYLVTPHLTQKIETSNKKIDLSWPKGPQVISTNTTQIIKEMLIRVARESPEHFPLDRITELAKFRIAAKSGTAQIALRGAYAKSGTIASVIGYFPADNPKFLVLVKLNEPEVRPWGSDTAGPIFFSILRDLVMYYNIAP